MTNVLPLIVALTGLAQARMVGQTPAPIPVIQSPQDGRTPVIQPKVTPVPDPAPVTIPRPPASDGNPATQPLTAEDAARIALKLQPSLDAELAQILAAQGRTQQTKAGLLPTVSVSAGYSHVSDIKTATSATAGGGTSGGSGSGSSGNGTGFNSNMTLTQLVFDFNHTLNAVRQAEALTNLLNDQMEKLRREGG
jgi:outer membrane protein TolC